MTPAHAIFIPSIQDSLSDISSSWAIIWAGMVEVPPVAVSIICKLNAALPRVGMRGRMAMATVLLVFLSWLAVPTAALVSHGSFKSPECHGTAHTRTTMCPGATASGNVGVFNAFLPFGQRLRVARYFL